MSNFESAEEILSLSKYRQSVIIDDFEKLIGKAIIYAVDRASTSIKIKISETDGYVSYDHGRVKVSTATDVRTYFNLFKDDIKVVLNSLGYRADAGINAYNEDDPSEMETITIEIAWD